MGDTITKEKIEKYVSLRDKFQKEKRDVVLNINRIKNIIEINKEKISDLEKDLENSRPRIEGCDKNMICKNCDIYSMKHEWTQPGQGERIFHYECVICGYHDYNT